jgi:hypothetical protein
MSKEAKRYSCGNGDGMFEDENGFYVKYSQPTQFKVATEDSCVVLEVPDAYDDYYRDANGVRKDYFDAMVIWNKAPSISEDRLELNKLRVENERLNKVILNHLEIESSNGRTFKSMSSKLTEANKQLKDSNFAIKVFVDNIDEWLDTGKAAGTKESKRIYELCKAVLNKSKLNKD